MTYDLKPEILRITPFQTEGGALAAVEVLLGPIKVSSKLYRSASGYFLSMPARRHEATEKWYDQVVITDPALKLRVQDEVVRRYEEFKSGALVAV